MSVWYMSPTTARQLFTAIGGGTTIRLTTGIPRAATIPVWDSTGAAVSIGARDSIYQHASITASATGTAALSWCIITTTITTVMIGTASTTGRIHHRMRKCGSIIRITGVVSNTARTSSEPAIHGTAQPAGATSQSSHGRIPTGALHRQILSARELDASSDRNGRAWEAPVMPTDRAVGYLHHRVNAILEQTALHE